MAPAGREVVPAPTAATAHDMARSRPTSLHPSPHEVFLPNFQHTKLFCGPSKKASKKISKKVAARGRTRSTLRPSRPIDPRTRLRPPLRGRRNFEGHGAINGSTRGAPGRARPLNCPRFFRSLAPRGPSIDEDHTPDCDGHMRRSWPTAKIRACFTKPCASGDVRLPARRLSAEAMNTLLGGPEQLACAGKEKPSDRRRQN